MKKYWFGTIDASLMNGTDVLCPRCRTNTARIDKIMGVLPCDQCNAKTTAFSTDSWTTTEKIKSRILMPDGKTVLSGRAGIAERDRRLKVQKEMERYGR